MIYKFTKSGEKVIEISNEIAIRLGHTYIGTEHLLYGLVKEKNGIASKVLEKQNINHKNVLEKIEEIIGKNNFIKAYNIGFTPRLKKVIENAYEEAKKIRSDFIGTEHLLIGIIKESDLPARSIKVLGDTKSKRINTLVTSLVRSGAEKLELDGEINEEFIRLHEFLFESVYRNPKAKSEESKVDGIIEGLFEHYINNPKEVLNNEYKVVAQREGVERAVVDYIAGMTDHFAIMAYSNIYIPKSWNY